MRIVSSKLLFDHFDFVVVFFDGAVVEVHFGIEREFDGAALCGNPSHAFFRSRLRRAWAR